jgi:hypothetical protein
MQNEGYATVLERSIWYMMLSNRALLAQHNVPQAASMPAADAPEPTTSPPQARVSTPRLAQAEQTQAIDEAPQRRAPRPRKPKAESSKKPKKTGDDEGPSSA